jgi:hypothetical protein
MPQDDTISKQNVGLRKIGEDEEGRKKCRGVADMFRITLPPSHYIKEYAPIHALPTHVSRCV